MLGVLSVVAPVFLLIGAGYGAVRAGLFGDREVDGILAFATRFAIPCLLFSAVATLDLGATFDLRFLVGFYAAATLCFALAVAAARALGRRPGESVAIGFGALFSNSLMIGLPVMERAYGAAALAPNFALIAVHAPFCYLLGILAMEFARADGRPLPQTLRAAGAAMFRNGLTIGIALGLAVNLTGLPLPAPVLEAAQLLGRAALPVALVALGGALTRYALRSGVRESGAVAALSLVLHPALAWLLCGPVFDLPPEFIRAAVVTAAMPPGINAYLFATQYGRAVDVAAASVLGATLAAVVSVTLWLAALAAVYP